MSIQPSPCNKHTHFHVTTPIHTTNTGHVSTHTSCALWSKGVEVGEGGVLVNVDKAVHNGLSQVGGGLSGGGVLYGGHLGGWEV